MCLLEYRVMCRSGTRSLPCHPTDAFWGPSWAMFPFLQRSESKLHTMFSNHRSKPVEPFGSQGSAIRLAVSCLRRSSSPPSILSNHTNTLSLCPSSPTTWIVFRATFRLDVSSNTATTDSRQLRPLPDTSNHISFRMDWSLMRRKNTSVRRWCSHSPWIITYYRTTRESGLEQELWYVEMYSSLFASTAPIASLRTVLFCIATPFPFHSQHKTGKFP